jgi:hypothetical protein
MCASLVRGRQTEMKKNSMATKHKKKELVFVREMREDYIDWKQTKPVSKPELERRRLTSKKSNRAKKAA